MSNQHTRPHSILTELDRCLFEEFDTQSIMQRFGDCLEGFIQFDRLGIATRVNQSEMEVLALYSQGSVQSQAPGRRFAYRGSVGEWVWKRKRSFIGKQRLEVRSFPSTYKQFEHDGFESNCVIAIPLPDRGPTFAYWLSRNPNTYSADNLRHLQRACEYLKPLILVAADIERIYRFSGDPLERAINQLFTNGSYERSSANGLPTLDAVQTQYIQRVLKATGWTIEGPDGAAAVLGLAPSTLRSRMSKLGIKRDH